MSSVGIKIFANVLSQMQEARQILIALGTGHSSSKSGQQDILLGQLLDKAKDAVKDEFCKITMEKV